MRFLTDALYESLQRHGRIEAKANQSLVWLLGVRGGEAGDGERLSDEQIPCRPDDDEFERLLKARLRRHVVERCIYAVDLDPLAVELCRLSLWIETMDRELPFGFLDHKVKCGNALVGAWFDQFQHYPAMAWKNREGGDRNHSNGVHFEKNARGRAIKAFHKDRLTPDMKRFLEGRTLFQEDLLEKAVEAHGDAMGVLAYMHELPVQDAAERADVYREELLGSSEWRSLKEAMDLWCACWFWPADEIGCAPLPTSFADPPERTRGVGRAVGARHRFFHWELEFPDVFCEEGAGFDGVVGNPPWENLQPNPEEFFSNEDPLFRTYGRLVKRGRQQEMFRADMSIERRWLDYVAGFKGLSNWVRNCANPFGDPAAQVRSQGSFPLGRGGKKLHRRWREARQADHCFSDPDHAFRLQMGRIFTYPLFLEQSLALLRAGGRCGLIIPSGIYGDAWTRPLRIALLERCRWEWLFGIENSGKIFPIHRSYKFNPVIFEKGGSTEAIQTAFMRRSLEDWERAEDLATPYTRAQVEEFSPKSRAILEIQSGRDLELLEKIYADSVLLGDDGPDGWGIKYKLEFMMNTDAKLFPPRPKWEVEGYRPDEYSRWLKGDWRPIDELWAELGVDPGRPEPVEVELEDWLFDGSAGPEQREAEARFVHGHLLKPGDVARTDWAVRCAQPPYDRLPVPRVEIPAGIVLSRDGREWIWEGVGIEDVALPLYEGRMIGQFDFSEKGWVSGKGRGAVWREIPWGQKQIEPQYLMSAEAYYERVEDPWRPKVAHMRIGSATNARTAVGSFLCGMPAGDTAATLFGVDVKRSLVLSALWGSFAFDFVTRCRVSGLHIDYHVVEQNPLLPPADSGAFSGAISDVARALCLTALGFAPAAIELLGTAPMSEATTTAVTIAERIRLRAILHATVAAAFGLTYSDLSRILEQCDLPAAGITGSQLNPKGFWRLDRHLDPELRHTVLTLVAFRDLESSIQVSGDLDDGIRAFSAQNNGEGWLLPETLRLADYGLGRDDRAQCHQPVASRLGPRFYGWQLAQSPEESWRECRLHARNLLGRAEYRRLIERLGLCYEVLDSGTSAVDADDRSRDDGATLRAAEPKAKYASDTVPAPPQTEILRRHQADLFE